MLAQQKSPTNRSAGVQSDQNNSQKFTPHGVNRVYHDLKKFRYAYLEFRAGVQNNEGWMRSGRISYFYVKFVSKTIILEGETS